MTQGGTVIKKAYLSPPPGSKIYDVGLRPFILSNMISAGFKSGNIQNLDDGRVVIALEGNADKIKQFMSSLPKKLRDEAEKDYSLIPKGITISEIKNRDNPEPIEICDLKDMASALMLEETSRGVGANTKGFRSLGSKFEGLGSKLEKLPEILEALSKKLQ